jgi:hypothetical protein
VLFSLGAHQAASIILEIVSLDGVLGLIKGILVGDTKQPQHSLLFYLPSLSLFVQSALDRGLWIPPWFSARF